MKKVILFLSILVMFGCSSERLAQYHYQKALKHGLKLIQDSDTIQIATIDSVAYYINDTIVYEKILRFTDSVIFFKNVYIPKTKWQTRIEYRYKTKVLKQDVLKYKYIYKDAKEKRKEVQLTKSKTNWMLLLWGLIAGSVLSFALKLLYKLYNPIK
jgi:hypothetical protein